MPDTDDQPTELSGAPNGRRNLPMLVARPMATSSESEGFFTRLARALFGWGVGSTRADIEVVLEATVPSKIGVSHEELTMLKNILALRGRRIDDVMVPRADIIAVQQDIALGELLKTFQIAAHSRLVVYNDTLDDPTGLVHIRDLIAFMTMQATVGGKKKKKRKKLPSTDLDLKIVDLSLPLSSIGIVREILFIPPSMPAIDLLAKMQASRIHLALVVDEYGGTDGLVSIEDIVEQIVGEIADEHDEDAPPSVLRQPDGSYLADARASLDDVTAVVGAEFDVGQAAKNVDTLGGYLMAQVGRLPLRGELVPGPSGFEIEVLDSDPRRVKKVKIHRGKDRPKQARQDDSEFEARNMTTGPVSPDAANTELPAKLSPDLSSPKTTRRP